MRSRRAFTLIELVLVMVIMSVVLAMAAPSLRGFYASRRTADAAAEMVALTAWARSEAIARGTVCRLNIDTTTNTFFLSVQDAGRFVEVRTEMGRQFRLPEGTTVAVLSTFDEENLSFLQFYPNGRSDPAVIELHDRRGNEFLVRNPSSTEPFQVVSPTEGEL